MNLTGKKLKINTLFNIMGSVLPGIAGLVLLPFLIEALSPERLGLFLLIMSIIGYASVFEFGIGKALTYEISKKNSDSIKVNHTQLILNGMALSLVFGMFGGFFVYVIANLSIHLLVKDNELIDEFRNAILLTSIAVPITVITSALRGVVEGYERFDISNGMKSMQGILAFGLPVLGMSMYGNTLLIATAGIVLNRLLFLPFNLYFIIKIGNFKGVISKKNEIKDLLSTCMNMGVSNLISPILVTSDRFVITNTMGASHLSYYQVPLEALQRVLILPASLTTTLFPALVGNKVNQSTIMKVYWFNCLILLFTLTPMYIFSYQLLELWINPRFAEASTNFAQILVIGVFFNGLAHFPYLELQASGKSNITANIHLIEFFLYIPLMYFATLSYGVTGASVAWTGRCLVDFMILSIFNREYKKNAKK